MPKCLNCQREMELVDENETCSVYACVFCNMMPEQPKRVYKNHCWNCYAEISSEFCRKSKLPNMGYHCVYCGEDLRRYHRINIIV